MANHMLEVAKVLGLKIDEEFKFSRCNFSTEYICKFTKETLLTKLDENWEDDPVTLFQILQDDSRIIKLHEERNEKND